MKISLIGLIAFSTVACATSTQSQSPEARIEQKLHMSLKQYSKGPVIILASAPGGKNTLKAVREIIGQNDIPIITLNQLDISPYDYQESHKNDDFLPLMHWVAEHDPIIFASPVYWYSMSAQMKILIERFTHIEMNHPDLKEKLKNKHVLVISSYGSKSPPTKAAFDDVFRETAVEMNMQFIGCYHYKSSSRDPNFNKSEIEKAQETLKQLLKQ